MQSNNKTTQQNNQPKGVYLVPTKNRKRALWAIFGPFLLLFVILPVYAISTFIFHNLGVGQSDGITTIAKIINVFLSLLGIIAVIGIPAGIGYGFYILGKRELVTGVKYDARSGRGDASEIPEEIKGWSWGAAGLGLIWGIYHRVWFSFIALVPYVGMIWFIVMGIKGKEWAWRANKYISVEDFNKSQRKWNIWGLVLFIISMIIIVGYIVVIVFALSGLRGMNFDEPNDDYWKMDMEPMMDEEYNSGELEMMIEN